MEKISPSFWEADREKKFHSIEGDRGKIGTDTVLEKGDSRLEKTP